MAGFRSAVNASNCSRSCGGYCDIAVPRRRASGPKNSSARSWMCAPLRRVLAAVDDDEIGSASGVLSAVQAIGGSIGVAV